jgi:hypothetical protein
VLTDRGEPQPPRMSRRLLRLVASFSLGAAMLYGVTLLVFLGFHRRGYPITPLEALQICAATIVAYLVGKEVLDQA